MTDEVGEVEGLHSWLMIYLMLKFEMIFIYLKLSVNIFLLKSYWIKVKIIIVGIILPRP